MPVATDRNGRHAQAFGGIQVGWVIINHQAERWVFVDGSQGDLKGFKLRFTVGVNGIDINDLFKMYLNT